MRHLATPGATKRRAGPRNASFRSVRRTTSWIRTTRGRNCGTCSTGGSMPAKTYVCSRCPTGPSSTSDMTGKDLLRFITCGSVDDGKSTLIGRLLHDSKLILEDQLSALARDSERHGTVEDDIDFALLVDGLEAEREQGITIDVAYRFFTTARRSFVVADTPGHEQYTRNMATGASTAQLAIILIDARKGVLVQTRRHSVICSRLGIR